jgi:TrmH RNA methyltransferase
LQLTHICGLNAVTALFRRRPGDVARLYYTAAARLLAGPFCAELAKAKKPYRELPPDEMAKATGTAHHGGIAAVAKPVPVPFLDGVNPPDVPLLLVLDQIGNPHNLGAIARSAVFFGVRALLLHETPGAAMPSDAAYRTAEGALEYLDIFRTKDLARALRGLAPHYRIAAATLRREAVPYLTMPRDRKLALVLGNEERGVSEDVLHVCRREIRIDAAGPVQSLNVAQAAAVLLAAFTASA